jgi:hypothetical protein
MEKKTQKTRKGHEIPVPKRGDVFRVLKKAAAHQDKESRPRSPKK